MQDILRRLKRGEFPGFAPHFLEARNSPDKPAQQLLEDRCGKLSPSEIDFLSAEKGFAAGIYMPTPHSIVLVHNNKTRTGVEEYAATLDRQGRLPRNIKAAWQDFVNFRDEHGAREAHRVRRRSFGAVRSWAIEDRKEHAARIRAEYDADTAELRIEALELHPFKPDKLGFFGGKIYEWEKFLYGVTYPLEAFARETREEGGIHPIWSTLVETNVADPKANFEKWFFWVLESTYALHTEGVKGETDPPVEIPIERLSQSNFYWSHAKVLLKHLKWLVEVAEAHEYADSYETLRRNFGVSLRPRFVAAKQDEKPALPGSGDESWEAVMASVQRPTQLQR